ncbi:DUF4232 domain-containing protein [Streptomyces sp. MMG1121]|uniref:DUF4232 domain-containing protein n=1 Tax=Streptomyces sp. MMG1121 TaxID=1415544 RepID=UPI0006AE89FD|nr:DUF4232 domain-containing protein [Streptomyces sp. MMG1121]
MKTLAVATLAAGAVTLGGGITSASATTGKAAAVTCTPENTKVTVGKVSRPINHLLLEAKNTGTRACNAYFAPRLKFDNGQAFAKVWKESRPQAVVTLAPGKSAYASVLLQGEGTKAHEARTLTVHFMSSTNGSTGTTPVQVTLPKSTYTDSAIGNSYWQDTAADALVW